MENDNPIVLELEARLAEAASLASEASLTEIRGRALATLEPLFFEWVAQELDRADPDKRWGEAVAWLKDRAGNLRSPALHRRL